jgi:hypothetical protein
MIKDISIYLELLSVVINKSVSNSISRTVYLTLKLCPRTYYQPLPGASHVSMALSPISVGQHLFSWSAPFDITLQHHILSALNRSSDHFAELQRPIRGYNGIIGMTYFKSQLRPSLLSLYNYYSMEFNGMGTKTYLQSEILEIQGILG